APPPPPKDTDAIGLVTGGGPLPEPAVIPSASAMSARPIRHTFWLLETYQFRDLGTPWSPARSSSEYTNGGVVASGPVPAAFTGPFETVNRIVNGRAPVTVIAEMPRCDSLTGVVPPNAVVTLFWTSWM